ncbi:hypothetical protein [Mycolicibacterium goodii]|uniref:Lipoprotein n=1 Tax=Mycolicibacterium goodii TaxID=134601 RepID=A0ABS6HPF8_MYCGD|nr:hypothetical protein [Mycolicibacterium goodii]MBU8817319.1 hypothetical protein [Mycolicibacterium goodii]MBU8824073.1 hypothetical protein [Mycolicibacterium goodii]MBU8840353.1 hypothetical protein [Mycolicibacterium goodii]ULN48841.1 hypothetical protein MI170_05520 [Mycolicibacterium goodii]
MRRIAAVAAAGFLLTGCAIEGTPVAAPVDDEWRDAVAQAVAGLGGQLGPISDAMGTKDYLKLQSACADLRSYVDKAKRKVLPGPDMHVNEALRDGFDGYRSMAEQCMTLTASSSPTQLRKFSDTIDGADKRIKDGLELLGIEIPRR